MLVVSLPVPKWMCAVNAAWSYNPKWVVGVFFIPFMLLFSLPSSVYSLPVLEQPTPTGYQWDEVVTNPILPAPIDHHGPGIDPPQDRDGSGSEGILKGQNIVETRIQLAEVKPGVDKGKFWLESFRSLVQELESLEEQIKIKGSNCVEKIKINQEFVSSIKDDASVIANINTGKRHCYEANKLRKGISDIYVAMENDAELVNTKIKSAKGRAEICHTEADENFIKHSYQDAKDNISSMKRNLHVARDDLASMKAELEKIEKINALLAGIHDKKKWQNRRFEYEKRLKETDQCIYALKVMIPENINELRTRVKELKGQISDKRRLYGRGPASRADFDSLIAEVNQIRPVQPISRYKLHGISKRHQKARSRKPDADPPSISCFTAIKSEYTLQRAEELFYTASRALGGNDNLLAVCKEQLPSLSPATAISEHVNAGGSTQGSVPVERVQANTKKYNGGLTIVGPKDTVAGSRVSYTACDEAGNPYASGDFSWNVSSKDILSISGYGNPVNGLGIKSGTSMIFVHHDGLAASMDVTVKAKEGRQSGGNEMAYAADNTFRGRQDQICENIEAEMRIACLANNPQAVIILRGDVQQHNCSIDPEIWRWCNSIIGADNRSADQVFAQERQPREEVQAAQQQQDLENWMSMMDMLANGGGDIQGAKQASGVNSKPSDSSGNTGMSQEKWMDALNKFAGMAGDIQGVNKPSGGNPGPTDGYGNTDESQANLMDKLSRFAGVMGDVQRGTNQNTDGDQEKWMDMLNKFAGMAGDIQGFEQPCWGRYYQWFISGSFR